LKVSVLHLLPGCLGQGRRLGLAPKRGVVAIPKEWLRRGEHRRGSDGGATAFTLCQELGIHVFQAARRAKDRVQ